MCVLHPLQASHHVYVPVTVVRTMKYDAFAHGPPVGSVSCVFIQASKQPSVELMGVAPGGAGGLSATLYLRSKAEQPFSGGVATERGHNAKPHRLRHCCTHKVSST
jgi:hypothetical protein